MSIGYWKYWKCAFESDVVAIAEGVAFITSSEYGEFGKV